MKLFGDKLKARISSPPRSGGSRNSTLSNSFATSSGNKTPVSPTKKGGSNGKINSNRSSVVMKESPVVTDFKYDFLTTI
jgi:hypothetical protein